MKKESSTPKFMMISDMHLTVGEAGKEAGLIPTGTWKLRAVKIQEKKYTYENDEGDDVESSVVILTEEPIEPTKSVSQEEVNAIDPTTGQAPYAGRRLWTRFDRQYPGALRQLGQAMGAYGFGSEDDLQAIIKGNTVRGKTCYGEVYTNTFDRRDGSTTSESRVKQRTSLDAVRKAQAQAEQDL